MIQTIQNLDQGYDSLNLTAADIVASITLNDVKYFLEKLGVTELEVNEERGYIICPTICHNPLHEAHSMKLYWYQNNKIFRCYTECNEAMSIFKLYQKFIAINEHIDISFYDAEEYVKKCIKHLVIVQKEYHTPLLFDLSKYTYGDKVPQQSEYPKEVITAFTHYYHPEWLKEGITPQSMDKFNIRFSLGQNKIVIPHYDIDGRLIGIRGRTFEKLQPHEGKYQPLQLGSILYSHHLGFNLYGIYEHKYGIKVRRSAIIVEGEKSVLLDDGYYDDFSNAVACCGLNVSKYQISLLVEKLDVNEIILAFDKEYSDWNSEKARKYKKEHIESVYNKFKNKANFSYIWDYDNLLNEKDSPFDKGKDVFEELYKNRIKL